MRCLSQPLLVVMISGLVLPTPAFWSPGLQQQRSTPSSKNIILEWNEIATDAYDRSPPGYANGWRGITIAQVAVFDAVNAIEGRYQPYLNPKGPLTSPPGASVDAAAATAAYRVLRTLYPKEFWSTIVTGAR